MKKKDIPCEEFEAEQMPSFPKTPCHTCGWTKKQHTVDTRALVGLISLIQDGVEQSDAGLAYLDGTEPEVLAAREALGL